jgi:putative endonuclease
VVEVSHAKVVGGFEMPLLEVHRRLLLGVKAVLRGVSRSRKLPAHLQTGLRGEFEALFFLRREGFTIAERRWRSPELQGDLDLMAWEMAYGVPTLCIVEVKTRTARDMTPAGLAVTEGKRRILREMAASYVRTLAESQRRDVLVRFDIVSVYLLRGGIECELVRDAYPRLESKNGWLGV